MLRHLLSQFAQPILWLELAFILLAGFAVWRLGGLLLRLLAPHLSARLQRSLTWLWAALATYATLAAAVHGLGLSEVPFLYDQGNLIIAGFRATSGQVLVIGALALIAWNLVVLTARRVVPEAATSEFSRSTVRVQTLVGVIEGSLRLMIVLLAGISILQALGVNAAALLAGVSVLGLAVGFGAQSLIKDVFTGFFILLEDQYGVGDVISVNNSTLGGGVERLSLRSTSLRALDGTVHIIPNGQIQTVSVSSKDWSQVVASVDVSYDADIDAALEVLESVSWALHTDEAWSGRFLAEPELLGVSTLTQNAVRLQALYRVLPKSQWALGREFNRRIKLALDAAGIEIASSQRSSLLLSGAPLTVRLLGEDASTASRTVNLKKP
ncbi:mechanosensitive ion channel family protein [Deinococcus sp.]|uniref:mechanosensitive ion channel family protein n=1 Tax=Deinococcus sp. TaxID=47478 RepID=UPI003CC68BAB